MMTQHAHSLVPLMFTKVSITFKELKGIRGQLKGRPICFGVFNNQSLYIDTLT